jgi:hypothetical protein
MEKTENIQQNKEATLPEKIDFNNYKFAVLDQIKAADYTLKVIKDIDNSTGLDSSLGAVKETDIFRLRRGLCLPSASASCINWVVKDRIIGDDKGEIKVGDIYRILLPFHSRKDFADIDPDRIEKGWLFATPEGDVYHQAIVAFSEGLGVPALPAVGFDSVATFKPLLEQGGAVAVSLDNKFVIDHTLKGNSELVEKIDNDWKILIEGPSGLESRKFEEGRHVVSILELTEDGFVIIVDSFRLPQMSEESTVLKLPIKEVDKYLNYSTGGSSRGILFAKDRNIFSLWQNEVAKVVVPEEIVATVKRDIKRSAFSG